MMMLIKEHRERKDELRRVLDPNMQEDSKKISPELIIDLAIEDPSPDYQYLDWMVNQIKMGFFLGVDLKYIVKLIQEFHGPINHVLTERQNMLRVLTWI